MPGAQLAQDGGVAAEGVMRLLPALNLYFNELAVGQQRLAH
jgi:hypothetical protein